MADKKPVTIDVNIIGQEGQAALVEWNDGKALRRATIPAESVKDGKVAPEELTLGIPYGLPWAKLHKTNIYADEQIENALHGNGIWTLADVRLRIKEVIGIFYAVNGQELADFLTAADIYDQEVK